MVKTPPSTAGGAGLIPGGDPACRGAWPKKKKTTTLSSFSLTDLIIGITDLNRENTHHSNIALLSVFKIWGILSQISFRR